jgi:hypothetical protein
MRTEHFTKVDLTNLPSCFLDPKGNFIFSGRHGEIGVHEGMAFDILDETFGEDYMLDNYDKIRDGYTYTYEYLESELGYWRYSHWIGNHGSFNGEKKLLSHAQKLAIKQFCRVNGVTWERMMGNE